MPASRRDVVVMLAHPNAEVISSWLLGVPADLELDQVLAEAIPILLPLALDAGDLSLDDTEAMFGIRVADPVDDADLYAQQAREQGRLH